MNPIVYFNGNPAKCWRTEVGQYVIKTPDVPYMSVMAAIDQPHLYIAVSASVQGRIDLRVSGMSAMPLDVPAGAEINIYAVESKKAQEFFGARVYENRSSISLTRIDLKALGNQMRQAAVPAMFCEARLKAQIAAGGVDSPYDRERIRVRVSAELFMVSKIFSDVEDLNTLGEEFRRTERDVPGNSLVSSRCFPLKN